MNIHTEGAVWKTAAKCQKQSVKIEKGTARLIEGNIVIGPLNANTEGFQSTVCAGYLLPLDVTSILVRKSAEPKTDSTETKEVPAIGCWGNSDPESRESRNRLPPCPALPAGRDRDHGPGRHR